MQYLSVATTIHVLRLTLESLLSWTVLGEFLTPVALLVNLSNILDLSLYQELQRGRAVISLVDAPLSWKSFPYFCFHHK